MPSRLNGKRKLCVRSTKLKLLNRTGVLLRMLAKLVRSIPYYVWNDGLIVICVQTDFSLRPRPYTYK